MSDLFQRAKKAMRERRGYSRESVQQALEGTNPKTAATMFDLSRGEKGKPLDTNRRAHVKAIELVSSLLGSFSLPVRPTLEYHGMIKNAVDSNGIIQDGVVRVGATLRTLMGHKAHIEIPVIVRGNSLIEPAVFFFQDAPYVMCGPAIDDLIKRGSLRKDVQSRGMYSPPHDGAIQNNEVAREGIANHEHMFSPGARNPYNFRRQYSKTAQKDNTKDPAFNAWIDIDNKKEAQHKGEPRKRTNIDTPAERPELWDHDVQDEMLDPAERRRNDLYGVGANVSLTEDIQARERGGGHLIIPKGEHGKVLKDMEGDGKMLYVNFPDMLVSMPVPKRMLRSAAARRIVAQSSPEFVDETLLVSFSNDNFVLGASGSIDIPDEWEEGETKMMSGIAQYADAKWSPWSNDEGSRVLAEKLNQEGWMLSLAADAVPVEEVNWHRSAASIEQVRNEVKAMLREGYSQVDIKEAVKRKWPEHAAEALSSFNKSAMLYGVNIGVTYPQGMSEEEVVNRVKKMFMDMNIFTEDEIGAGKILDAPSEANSDGDIDTTMQLELDVNFVNGMSTGKYIEDNDGQVFFLFEAPEL